MAKLFWTNAYFLVGKIRTTLFAVRQWTPNGKEAELVRIRASDIINADPQLSRDTTWVPKTVGQLMAELQTQDFPATVNVAFDLRNEDDIERMLEYERHDSSHWQ